MAKDKGNLSDQLNQEPKDSSTVFVITSKQATTIVASTVIGAGVLTLPRTATEIAHQSAWISMLAGSLAAVFIMWIITKLGLRFPGKTIMEYGGTLLGTKRTARLNRWLALPIQLLLIAMWLVMAIIDFRLFGDVLISTVLPETPIEVIIGTLLVALISYVMVELEVVVRFNELMFPVLLLPIIFISALSFQKVRVTNLLPVVFPDMLGFLQSSADLLFALQGFSIMTVLMAFTQREHNVKSNIGGVAIPALIFTLLIVASLGMFGYTELQHLMMPTLELTKATNITFLILERLDALFIAVWVVAIFTTAGNLFYTACFSIAQILPVRKEDVTRRWVAVGFVPVAFWSALIPENIFEVSEWTDYIGYVGAVAYVLIILLYVLAVVRGKGKEAARIDGNG